VSAGCLASQGHQILGIDLNQTKVNLINSGQSPIIEENIPEIIKQEVDSGRLRADTEAGQAVNWAEISFVCVGTPSQPNGNLDLSFVERVCRQLGQILKDMDCFHVVVLRSTMLPGSMRSRVIPILEEYSGKKTGQDFGVCFNPEFLREGSAVYDFLHPPKTVIGCSDEQSGDVVEKLYQGIDTETIRTDIEVAEMVKYSDNTWHALKITFANELGAICKELKIDSHKVMDIFCKDTKLNISSAYLKPGFAFGGSCLPKDVRALMYRTKTLDVDVPIIGHIIQSNEKQIERGLKAIIAKGRAKVGVLGFSFKAGTDDLRESPVVELIERLLGKGYDLKIYDKNVNLASLIGANRDYILNRIPHISKLMMANAKGVLEHAETIVVGNSDPDFRDILNGDLSPEQEIIDLVRIFEEKDWPDNYQGICW
jgi:GDP-mannose 6-dehydrogenase